MSEEKSEKRGRGRPKLYTGALLAHIVALITALGLTKTRKLLNSAGAVRNAFQKKFGVTVDKAVVKKPLGISMVTLCHIGQEAGVQLKRGRPATKEAA